MYFLISDPSINTTYTNQVFEKYFTVHLSLFKHTKDEHLTSVAPMMYEIDGENFKKAINEIGVVINSYLIIKSLKPIEELATHFRSFLYQKVNGHQYYFRYWDSRVLKKFFPTCTEAQLLTFFGPIQQIICEHDDLDRRMILSLDRNCKLSNEIITKESFFELITPMHEKSTQIENAGINDNKKEIKTDHLPKKEGGKNKFSIFD